jgi:hypothetical protein
MMPIKAIFVDIGNTLGSVDLMTKTLTPFADMLAFLKAASRLFQVPKGGALVLRQESKRINRTRLRVHWSRRKSHG